MAEFQSQFDRHIDEKSPTGTPLSTITHHVVIHLSLIDDGGLQALGVLDVDGLDEGVELLLALLVVVTLTSDADTETVRDTLDAGFPDLLVELGVKADVLGTHSLLSKIPDGLDGAGSALLEGNTVQPLVKVDGVLAGHDILGRRTLAGSGSSHFEFNVMNWACAGRLAAEVVDCRKNGISRGSLFNSSAGSLTPAVIPDWLIYIT